MTEPLKDGKANPEPVKVDDKPIVDDKPKVDANGKPIVNDPGKPASDDGNKATPPERTIPEKYDLKLLEKGPLSTRDLDAIMSEAKAAKLTNAEAQALVDARTTFSQETAARFLAETKADPEIGGDKYDASIELAKKGLEMLFPANVPESAEIAAWLHRSGLYTQKGVVRAFMRVAKMGAEDKPANPAGGGGGNADTGLSGNQKAAKALYPGMNP